MKKLIFSIPLFTICYFALAVCYADIPRTINYQGKLTDKQGYALNGTYDVTFRLYDAPAAGNLLWQESHTGLSVQKGLFSVLLGTITPLNLPFDKQYYLSIQVGVDPEMTPRQALASAPYAFTSETGVPSGTIMLWPKDTPPNGWLLCDGSVISRTTYANLFAVIGTTYGAGDISTTFNLPNLKGNVPVGYDSSQTEFNVLGKAGGEKMHQLTLSEMPSHTHKILKGGGLNDASPYVAPAPDYRGTLIATDSSGGNGAHNNLQPYITLNYIIKT